MTDDCDTLRRLWLAYRRALYVVLADQPLASSGARCAVLPDAPGFGLDDARADRSAAAEVVLRIDQHSPFLAACYQRYGLCCAAFATACNPRSRTDLPAEENVRRQAALVAELDRCGLCWMPGESRDADGLWRESSVLVLGLSRRDTLRLAEHAEQYAVVHAGDDAVPRLLACAAMAKAGLS